MKNYTVGSIYHGFILQRVEFITDINSTVYLFQHELLGTPTLAIKNNDPNKTFCLAFQTVPEDSTGVAHILEHSVLMGSKKYPVHDVFGEINKGGLMTFLNAMTGADTTLYPFATRNMTEYFNIMDVYCDVTLNPLLQKTTFEQEGWHYHKESAEAPLQFQGVVYNEMKGAFSDPIRAIFHHIFSGLMPESTYTHESGGDPKNIPDLTYEEFIAFHKNHYHPSNSFLFFYGDAELDKELAAVHDNFFSHFDSAVDRALIQAGKNINEPVFIEDSYGVQPQSELKDKTFLAVGSAVGTVLDRKRNTAFQIIANILFNSDASPLKKAILDAGLCKDFGGLFMPSSCYKTFMMTYLVGSEPDKRDQFLDLYNSVLKELASEGIEHDLILSELNKHEFSVREELTKAQRGLDLISKTLPALKHGSDPFSALQIEDLLTEIRKQALEKRYFEQLINEYLVDNAATVVVTLTPDPDKITRTLKDEQKRLYDYEKALSSVEQEQLVARTNELISLQQTPPDENSLALLPSLTLNDLNKTPSCIVPTVEHRENMTLLTTELDTNHIMYMEFGFDCTHFEQDLLVSLDIFSTIATEIGTTSRDYIRFAKDINIFTGGLSHNFTTYLHKGSNEPPRAVLWFQVKALASYTKNAFDLVKEVFTELDLSNKQRIKEIVQREFAWAEHAVQSEGYNLASTRVFSQLSQAGQISEYVSGATAYLALKEMATSYEDHEDKFLDTLASIKDALFHGDNLLISGTGSAAELEVFKPLTDNLSTLLSVNTDKSPAATHTSIKQPRNQAFCTSAEVVYNVEGCTLFHNQDAYNGHFEVLKSWLSRDYLWNSVRQQGGAYGCFVQFSHISGNFALVSYRDPQIEQTYAAYEAIGDAVYRLDLSQSSLNQLIIGTYGSFTPLQGPAAQGLTARNEFLSGITPEFKQQRIEEIIETDLEKMRSFAPLFKELRKNSYKASIGNTEKIRAHASFFDDIREL